MNIGEKFYCPRCLKEIEDEGIICPHCGHDPAKIQNVHILEEGTLLQNGRYQLGASIGSGGFGITYAAWDIVLNQPVAIKEYYPLNMCERDAEEDMNVIINPGYEGLYQSGLFRFIREARILAALQNLKNVVPVLEWFEANNTAYIVMQYISGVTLEDYVKKNNIPPSEVIEMLRDLIDSLILVHSQGIIHRDISPSNIMVQEDGTLMLIDFGAASVKERMSKGEDHTVIYNRRYAPVEQYDENEIQGFFTDVYALSATIYHLICGEPPKESIARKAGDTLKSPREKNIRIKKYQNKAIMNGLILQPEKRTQNMRIFRSMLYNLPMPEEVTLRRRFMFRVISISAAILAAFILTAVNFTLGFPLGGGLRYSLRNDGFHVLGLTSETEKISLPPKIAGIDVVRIDDAAFQGSETLTEAVIPGSVNTVGRFAFNGCRNLRAVEICEGVRSLSAESFANCTGLQAVNVPSTLTDIDPQAFSNSGVRLVLLGSMDNPASIIAERLGLRYASIEARGNENGVTVTRYETRQNNAAIPDFIGGKSVTAIESGNESPVFPEGVPGVQSVILPEKLERIGDYAFLGVSISSIDLPAGLKHIGRQAFSQSFIENIEIPDSVEFLSEEAFYVCVHLKSVKLPSGIKEIPAKCFQACTSLNSVTIPKGVTKINSNAFQECKKLSGLEIPDGVKRIEHFAFMNCSALESLYLPPTLSRMFVSALDGCPKSLCITGFKGSYAEYLCARYGFKFFDVESVDEKISISPKGNMWINEGIESSDTIILPSYSRYSRAVPTRQLYRANALRSRNVILPEHMQTLSAGSFRGNIFVESIDCPPSLRSIGGTAFEGCKNLRAVNLREGLEEIGLWAFLDCENLSEIKFPSTLKSIAARAFENCKSLTAVNIPESMTLLDWRTFSGTGVISVDIPGNIVKCASAFENCKSLRNVTFSDGIRTIWGTFAGCTNLETVKIPSSVNQISRSAFTGCVNLRDVWIYSDETELDYVSDVTKSNPYLFSDSLNLTIHAHRGSSSHVYASLHDIKFEEIPQSDDVRKDCDIPTIKLSERVYTDEELLKMITPKPNDDKYRYWQQMRYALGYGFTELAYKCLEAYESAGDDDDKIWALSARRFMTQAKEHGYYAGMSAAFFEGRKEHPTMKPGDIVVEINGKTFRTEGEFEKLDKPSETGQKVFTVLRADDSGVLRKINVTVRKGNPLCAMMCIIPLTFEEF